MSINEMESKVNELRELKRMQDELAAEITALEDSLIQVPDKMVLNHFIGNLYYTILSGASIIE